MLVSSSVTRRLLVLVLPLALSAAPTAQKPNPPSGAAPPTQGGQRAEATFKASVEYVEVTARVTTADGQFVSDLTSDDFEVREEGRAQTVADFALVDLPTVPEPGDATAWRRVEPDVQTNASPFDGRIYVLVLDSLHVRPERTQDVRQMARRFLEQYFADGDMAAVVNTTGAAEPAQEFTASRAKLLSAVDKFSVTQTRLETDEPTLRETTPGGPMSLAQDTLLSLKSLADQLGGVRGRRKAIVFFSEGPGYCAENNLTNELPAAPGGGAIQGAGGRAGVEILTPPTVDEPKSWARGVLNDGVQKLVAAANRGNVAIYGVDPRRLTASPADARGNSKGADADGTSVSSCDIDAGVQSLHDLSDQTAGFTVANTNSLDAGFDRLRQENSRYYVLGYYPAERAPEGTFRRIEVRTRRPGLRVQARLGYRVPPRATAQASQDKDGDMSVALRDAMNNVLPVSGLRLSASAAAFRSDKAGADILVSVQVDGRDVTFRPADGRLTGSLELALGTMNSRGEKGTSLAEFLQLPLEEAARASVVASGIRVVRSLAVAPGRHQLRVGVSDRPSGRVGVVHIDLIVPDFRKAAFDLSGVLVSSSLAGRVLTARGGPLEQLQRELPGPPALTREFHAGENLAVYSELYGAVHGATVLATVVDDGGREVRRQAPAPIESGESPAASASADSRDVRRTIPLRNLQPGRYVLRIEAQSAAEKPRTVRREVPFTIVP
jgi:VWFA-related protein